MTITDTLEAFPFLSEGNEEGGSCTEVDLSLFGLSDEKMLLPK